MICKRILSLLLALISLTLAVSCSQPTGGTVTPASTPTPTYPATTPIESETMITEFTNIPSPTPMNTLTLSEEAIKLYQSSYDILLNRITDRGYAITSLTGTYVGMFTRDSAIQAMAHLSYGDSLSARAILRYLLSYHASLGLKRATHIIDNIRDEEYRNNYLNGNKSESFTCYEEQMTVGIPQFLINAPNNGAATPFVTKKSSVDSVQAYLEGQSSSKVVAEIYEDLNDKQSLVGKGSHTLESSNAGWKTIPLENTVRLTPGKTYYLKLYAPQGSGRVVWYGITNSAPGFKKSWNYDLNAYGGNGWREVDVYTSFVIGESDSQVTFDYNIAQRSSETGIYIINAPNNKAAQPFIPKNNQIRKISVNLAKSSNADKVIATICSDYKDPSTALGSATYQFGNNPSGWQSITFENPVTVTPGKTYYLVLQATENSGKVVWNGSTSNGSLQSVNYDVSALGGWESKPYYPAFEIISYSEKNLAQGFEARGNTISGIDLDVFAQVAQGDIKVEIRKDHTDPKTVIASAQTKIDKTGENTYRIEFDSEVSVEYKGYYYLVITFVNVNEQTRLLTDSQTASDSYSFENSWERIGYRLLANVSFNVDKTPIITIDKNTSATQEIPSYGEIITSVKVLLSKDKDASGQIKASLYKKEGDTDLLIDTKSLDASQISESTDWVTFTFDLPLFKINKSGNYYLVIDGQNTTDNIYWCGSSTIDNYQTFTQANGVKTTVRGEASFEALRSDIRLISDYTQTDANYMLIHAWVMYVNNNPKTPEDLSFIEQSYPIIKGFANYYIDDLQYYNLKTNLILNPSLEHSRKIRYWRSYDLLTNVFASQALYELSQVAEEMNDTQSSEKWMKYSKQIESGINTHLVTEIDGKKIYGEFYDVDDNMKFYPGISWVNLAPVAAEWYGMDIEIMKNTFEVYKKYASIKMYGIDCLATEATLGTNELTKELIGKGIAWELMFCNIIGDRERIEEIIALELATAEKNNISVYPEFWKSESYVTDPGNQEHCSWQFYAMSKVFPQLTAKKTEG